MLFLQLASITISSLWLSTKTTILPPLKPQSRDYNTGFREFFHLAVRPWIPLKLRREAFQAVHELPHTGIRATKREVARRFV